MKPLLVLLIFVSFFACKSHQDFKAVRPTEKYMYTDTIRYNQKASVINIPIEIPVLEIEKQLNAQMPELLYEDNKMEDDNMEIKVWRRENLTIDAEKDVFNVKIPLKVWVKAGKFGIYKEINFSMNAKIATQLKINQDWQLRTITTPKGYDWVSKPVFDLGFIKIPITGIIEDVLDEQIPNVSKELDKYVGEKVEIKKYVQQIWTQMQSPTLLSKDYDLWLKVMPVEIMMTPINGHDKKARATIGIKTFTESVIGDKPEQIVNPTLPALQLVNQISDEFNMGISGEISHKQAKKMLSAVMVGQSYAFQNGKYNITVKDL
ncbi:MAG: DUF4403 family protein, partial [Verrucomicrobia bacterium]|nr:DUF4403 family protein [Cytophagales bacterium]